jgi:arylsulfatase A-like enzyme
MIRFVVFFVLPFLAGLVSPTLNHAAEPRRSENVIYVTLDGFRWQEMFGGAQEVYIAKDSGVRDVKDIKDRYLRPTAAERRAALMPFFWNVVAKDGQVFGDPESNARARITNTHKFSYPGYSEMFCGFADDAGIKSNDKNPNPHVNVLEFLNHRPGFEKRVAAYATWDVIPFILNRERSGLFVHAGTGPIVDEPLSERQRLLNEVIAETVVLWKGNGIDSLTMAAAREHFIKHKPRVMYLGLGETDEWGHERRYDLYLDAANKADAFLRNLWDLVQSQPEYRGKTSLVISTDHGRGGTVANWTDHGAKVEGAEFLWMAVLGPDTPALGVRRDVEATQSQIAATLAQLVGEDFRAASPKSAAPLPGVVEASKISSADQGEGKKDLKSRPNFVVVYADDLGYGDLGCYGAKHPTPNLDRMAAEGRRFTSFYVAQAVCSASRAALLTGCYPNRIGIQGALGPADRHGIHDDERTIAEVLKPRGYACGVFGKWHLGHHPQFLPLRHGFDEYLGLPYSNDMWPQHPTAGARFPNLPLIDGDRVVNANVSAEDQATLTRKYTERAVAFIERHKDEPFFLYVPHSMPHVPIFAGDDYRGKSGHGLYADVIQEIDGSVGQILEALKKHGLDERTLMMFTSDNGPWLSYGNHGGSAGPLREGKGTTWEGGMRVPCIVRWPGHVPRGTVSSEIAATIDVLPTLAKLAGVDVAGSDEVKQRPIDGVEITQLLLSDESKSPHDAYFIYWGKELQAIRSGRWKLHFPHAYQALKQAGADGKPGLYEKRTTDLALYDLESDIGETKDVAGEHPEEVERLKKLADRAREELGDTATGAVGKGVRPAGKLAD